MMITMNESKYNNLSYNLENNTYNLTEHEINMISYNMRCYDFFLTIPDDTPEKYKKIIKEMIENKK
jgi:hypothetical protein